MDGPYKCSSCGYQVSEFDNPSEHHPDCPWTYIDEYGNIVRYDGGMTLQPGLKEF